jgi:hypothetical protein
LSGAALLAAVAVLIAFSGFVLFMLTELGAADVRWTRLAWMFASVEAIAFGAAGALFGSNIQRSRAENAEADARRNANAAANGRALASTLVAHEPDAPAGGALLESLGPSEVAGARAVAAQHAALARHLFPELTEG